MPSVRESSSYVINKEVAVTDPERTPLSVRSLRHKSPPNRDMKTNRDQKKTNRDMKNRNRDRLTEQGQKQKRNE